MSSFDIANRFNHPMHHPRTVLITLLFSVVLIFGYVTFVMIFKPGQAESKD